jgi:uncharacterized protein (DUF1330 family)
MPAYFIADIEVLDASGYEQYRTAAAPTVAQYGGKYIVRGGQHQVLEGDWRPNRLVVLEFESVEAAQRWYASPEYGEAKKHRERSARMNAILVQGMDPQPMTGFERGREG